MLTSVCKQMGETKMSIRCYFLGAYNSEGVKGIVGGSDRIAAVKAVISAAGGTLNHVSFLRGPFDIIVDMEMPNTETIMGAMAAVNASGAFSNLMYLECVDNEPIVAVAQKIIKSYTPANA